MRIVCERADGPWNEVLGFRGVRICVSAERQYRWEKPRQGPSALPRREVRLVRSAVVARYGATFRFGHAVAVEAVGPDSVRIGVRLPFCSVRSGFSHGAGAVSYMLLEPSALVGCGSQSRPRDYAVGDTIPVMACTAGIPKTAEHGGQRLERFCATIRLVPATGTISTASGIASGTRSVRPIDPRWPVPCVCGARSCAERAESGMSVGAVRLDAVKMFREFFFLLSLPNLRLKHAVR